MPRFYFDYRDAAGTSRDEIGLDLAGLPEAVLQARRAAAEAMADETLSAAGGGGRFTIAIDVRNEADEIVHTALVVAADLQTPASPAPPGDTPNAGPPIID